MEGGERNLDRTTSSMDVLSLNNLVVSMRPVVKRAKAFVVKKLIKQMKLYRQKKGSDEQVAANIRRAERLAQEVQAFKILKPDQVSKFSLGNTRSFNDIAKEGHAGERAVARASQHKLIQERVSKFRAEHEDWKALAAFILSKTSGRRIKKKKKNKAENKQKSEEKDRKSFNEPDRKQESDTGAKRLLPTDESSKDATVSNQDTTISNQSTDNSLNTMPKCTNETKLKTTVDENRLNKTIEQPVENELSDEPHSVIRSTTEQPVQSDNPDSDIESSANDESSSPQSPGDSVQSEDAGDEEIINTPLEEEHIKEIPSTAQSSDHNVKDEGSQSLLRNKLLAISGASEKGQTPTAEPSSDQNVQDAESQASIRHRLLAISGAPKEIQAQQQSLSISGAPKEIQAQKQVKVKRSKDMVITKLNLQDADQEQEIPVEAKRGSDEEASDGSESEEEEESSHSGASEDGNEEEDEEGEEGSDGGDGGVPSILTWETSLKIKPKALPTRKDPFFMGAEGDSDDANEEEVEEKASYESASDEETQEEGRERARGAMESTFIGTLKNPGKKLHQVSRWQEKGGRGNFNHGRPMREGKRFSDSRNPFSRQGMPGKQRPQYTRGQPETSTRGRFPPSRGGRGGSHRGMGGAMQRGQQPMKGPAPVVEEKLHPSWEASRKRKEQQVQIGAFAGKKIKFDDD